MRIRTECFRRACVAAAGVGIVFLTALCPAQTPIPEPTGLVVDRAEMFPEPEQKGLEAFLVRIASKGEGAFAVLTVPRLQDEELATFGKRASEKWGVGQGQPAGMLLVIAKEDREFRFDVGKAWQPTIGPERVEDLVEGLVPFFKQENYAEGVAAAANKVSIYVTGEALPGMPPEAGIPRERTFWGGMNGLLLLLLAALVAVLLYIRVQQNKARPTVITAEGPVPSSVVEPETVDAEDDDAPARAAPPAGAVTRW